MIRPWFWMCLMLVVAAPGFAGDLTATDVWIRQPPPGSNAAAYLTLTNRGSAARSLVGVSCAAAEKAELHESKVEDGVARMTPVERVEVPAGGATTLAPMGLHIMLIRPTLPAAGESVELVLELDGGETLSVSAEVRGMGHEAGGGHDHH
ncbi:MAG: copper chaperone PCu(A)C [Deltaproteobacteria bacterium]|nr:copper chaperone PCu(A)C [Deltaproteobacteria bacterium]MBW2394751.1 copper chaperone PCu(A)C [Deltaproteobacteria bacterium]